MRLSRQSTPLLAVLFVITLVLLLAVAGANGQSDEAIANFLRWLRENGADTNAVAWPVEFNSTGRGGLALRDIADGDEFLRIPMSLCMTNLTAEGTPLAKVTEQLDGFQGLVFVLMTEKLKGRNSKWAPFIDILPATYDKVVLWSDEELDELQDQVKKQDMIHGRAEQVGTHQSFLNLMKENDIHIKGMDDLKLYQWAQAATGTRCFQVNDTIEYALVPFADLLNHHPESPVRWKERDGTYIMFADGGGFERGTQVFNNYGGEQSNFRLLSDYGFMTMDNEHNVERIPLHLSEDEELSAVQRGVLRRDHIRLFTTLRPLVIMRYFRVASAEDPAEARYFLRPSHWTREHRAAKLCFLVASDELGQMATTLAEDYPLLAEAKGRRRWAIMYRLERKRVLKRTADFCQYVVDQILPCVASKVVLTPRYVRLLLEAADKV